MNNIHTLVIPDIHGRTFWKEAINKFPKDIYPELPIIFLGDYLDPYDFEGITRKQAIENFKEIIDVAKNDNRIHLLIGNHDMHYWYDAYHKSRIDPNKHNCEIIKDLFLKNFTLFNIAYEEIINNEKYLYTHAGMTSFWLKHLQLIGGFSLKTNIGKLSDEQKPFCEMLKNMIPDADKLNKMKLNFQGQANLWMASYVRGGDDNCGSCIWADLEEWSYENSPIEGIWQIFGHTLIGGGDLDKGIINKEKKFAMLDARQAWVITDDGEILKLKDYNSSYNT